MLYSLSHTTATNHNHLRAGLIGNFSNYARILTHIAELAEKQAPLELGITILFYYSSIHDHGYQKYLSEGEKKILKIALFKANGTINSMNELHQIETTRLNKRIC